MILFRSKNFDSYKALYYIHIQWCEINNIFKTRKNISSKNYR